ELQKKNNSFAVEVGMLEGDLQTTSAKEQAATWVELALDLGNGQIVIVAASGSELKFCQYYHCYHCDIDLPTVEPRNFSFNSPAGACPKCLGLGTRLEVDQDLVIPNQKLTL